MVYSLNCITQHIEDGFEKSAITGSMMIVVGVGKSKQKSMCCFNATDMKKSDEGGGVIKCRMTCINMI